MAKNPTTLAKLPRVPNDGGSSSSLRLVEFAESPDTATRHKWGAPPHSTSFNHGLMWAKAGDFGRAANLFREAIRLGAGVEAYFNLGFSLFYSGKPSEAIAAYRQAISIKRNSAEAHRGLGLLLYQTGDLRGANTAYRRAIDLTPKSESAELRCDLGTILGKLGKLSEAISALGEAISIKPDLAIAHHNLGAALFSSKRLAEAIVSFETAIRIQPDFAEAYDNLGRTLMKSGKPSEAIAAYEKAELLGDRERAGAAPASAEAEKIGVYESKKPDYDGDDLSRTIMDEAAKACKPAADYFGLPVEVVTETLAELRAKAARETTARAKSKPRAKWEKRKGADADLSPPEFVAKHYAAEMAAGTLHRGVIAQEDKPLAIKLANWLRTHPMPEGIDIPTLPKWNTRQLAKAGDDGVRAAQRLAFQASRRRKLVPAA